MRIVMTGDRNWYAPDLAEEGLNRLMLRHGPRFVIVLGGATGIDRSFAEAYGEEGTMGCTLATETTLAVNPRHPIHVLAVGFNQLRRCG